MKTLHNYVAGRMAEPASGAWLDNHEPATGRVTGRTPDSGAADLEAAVSAARDAFPDWSALPAAERSRWLRRLAEAVSARADELALAESDDTGKPLSVAQTVDIPRASANLHFFADAATQFASEAYDMGPAAINYTLRRPHGVVACISPWNLPLYLFTWKIAPALAAGNCVIGKPSEVTPVTATLFGEICKEIGLPPGVLNILHGRGASVGQAIVEHVDVSAVSFTGGTATGAAIARTAAPVFKKLSLELGGKNASVVFADCDLERTLDTTVRAAFSNQGEICLCGSRVLVEASIYDAFRDGFVERVEALRVGDPRRPETEQGALVSAAHREKVLGCIEAARADGGRVLCGGGPVVPEDERCRDGWFVAPTVVDGLGPGSRTNQDEIFGPVATLIPFEDEEQALEIANGTRYGLAASLFSRDVHRCHRLAQRLEAGLIWINTWMLRDLRVPMGGMKHSGVGREGGLEAMRFFTEPRNVCVSIEA